MDSLISPPTLFYWLVGHMPNHGGYLGKLLRVDLTNERVRVENLDWGLLERYLGGRGLGARILIEEVPPNTDPLSEGNKLIVATGPLNGTPIPCSSKVAVVTKSPHTGIYLETLASSELGAELKYAGYDALVVEGRAEKPTYLLIRDGTVEFRSASHLWGMFTENTVQFIRRELKDLNVRVACIGPSGERLVSFSSIITDDSRAFGWGGAGDGRLQRLPDAVPAQKEE